MLEQYYDEFTAADCALIGEITAALDASEFSRALALSQQRLEQPLSDSPRRETLIKGVLAGLLVDIGSEGHIESAIHQGLTIMEKNSERLLEYISVYHYEYNLGNAKYSLYSIKRQDDNFFPTPENIDLLTQAKNHYWKSYRLLEESSEPAVFPQLLINLANTLDTSSRVTEAIVWYDLALKIDPDCLMANFNRSECLIFLSEISCTHTIEMLYQALKGFRLAINDRQLPLHLKKLAESRYSFLNERIQAYDYSEEELESHRMNIEREANEHSVYRRFCLDNRLALSEHSLYCQCVGARRDDLSIPLPTYPIGGEFVPSMELLLNRLKSEFALARLLYFQATSEDEEIWNVESFEATYTELFDDECIGISSEMLRTSFRLCFGVLDKIARGICNLYNLAEPQEQIYFHSFWKKQRPRGIKQRERWKTVNKLKNPALTALYSQATDLDQTGGEWKEFKVWRDALEHEVLLLFPEVPSVISPYIENEQNDNYVIVGVDEFCDRTLELLQFTASAIFNFVFCVRYEGLKKGDMSSGGLLVRYDKKSFGPS